jgi:hypothetical protein
MRRPIRNAVILLALSALLAPGGAGSADDPSRGWKESTASGIWGGVPERRAGFTDNGVSVEMTLPPGTGVAYSRSGRFAHDNAALRLATDNVNTIGNDYLPGVSNFPVSVTFVFGDDSLKLGVKQRVWLFFRQVWNGFTPSGIRLTYAWGNRLPVGSMFRLWEEETVFVLAGPDEVGKAVNAVRRLSDDFRAAYGRPPKGPVTEVVLRAGRPSGEKGAARSAATVRFPAD